MIFINRQNKINKNVTSKKLNRQLIKEMLQLDKKEKKLDDIKNNMDKIYKEAIECGNNILKLQSEGKIELAAQKSTLKVDLTKRHSIIQKKYIDMNREVEFIRQRVKKIDILLGKNKKE